MRRTWHLADKSGVVFLAESAEAVERAMTEYPMHAVGILDYQIKESAPFTPLELSFT